MKTFQIPYLFALLVIASTFPAASGRGVDLIAKDLVHVPSSSQLQVDPRGVVAGARKLLVNLKNSYTSGAREDKKHKSVTYIKPVPVDDGNCPVHIMVFWPALGQKVTTSILQELQSTPGLNILRMTRFPFPKKQKDWAKCHAKFYGRNQLPERLMTVKPHWADPKFVEKQKGFGPVLAAAIAIDCSMSRWKDAPGTEGTHDAAFAKFKIHFREKHKIQYALHASDDAREAPIDITSFFGDGAYKELVDYRNSGGRWDGSTIGQGPAGCPVPGPDPRVRNKEETKAYEAHKAKLRKEREKRNGR